VVLVVKKKQKVRKRLRIGIQKTDDMSPVSVILRQYLFPHNLLTITDDDAFIADVNLLASQIVEGRGLRPEV
jgi:hypothetical protein